MAEVVIEQNKIIIKTHFHERIKVAAIPGGRWNAGKKCWIYPATPAVAEAVAEAFNGSDSILGELLTKARRRREAAQQIMRSHGSPPEYVHVTEPWAHQVDATRYVIALDAAMLHCHMGTGKTKITLDSCAELGDRTILVICPRSVIDVWHDELEKHQPGKWAFLPLREHSVKQRADELRQALSRGRELLVVVNYEAAWREPLASAILAGKWDCVAFDESHRIKAPGSKQSRFAARINAHRRLALTGTPMPHSPLDLYGQFRALDPGIFGTRFAMFRARYAVMGGFENRQVLKFQRQEELRERMDKICWHVPKSVLDLPPIQTIDRECLLDGEAALAYQQMEKYFIAEIDAGLVTASNALAKMLRLQQIAAGFLPVDDGIERVGSQKADLLAELLEDIGKDERAIVFCRFRADLALVHEIAEKLGRSCGEISGSAHDYRRWKDGEFDTLAVQIQAGGLGVDLTEASYAIYYTLGFSLGDYLQSVARLHRPGQKNPVIVYRLLAKGTIDVRIVRALSKRHAIVSAILDEINQETKNEGAFQEATNDDHRHID